MQFKQYAPNGFYEDKARRILRKLILSPDSLTFKWSEKLIEVLNDISPHNTHREIAEVLNGQGRRQPLPLLIEAILFYLSKGDEILSRLRKERTFSYGSEEEDAFEELKGLVAFDQDFAELVLALWAAKYKLGMNSFKQFWCSLKEYWDELEKKTPQLFAAHLLLICCCSMIA